MAFYLRADSEGVIDDDPDFYHESINVLAGLSVRELKVLYHLDAYQSTTSHHDEIKYQPEKYVSHALSLAEDDILATFHKLLGSGLVIQCPLIGGNVRVYTSPNYRKIKALILDLYES